MTIKKLIVVATLVFCPLAVLVGCSEPSPPAAMPAASDGGSSTKADGSTMKNGAEEEPVDEATE